LRVLLILSLPNQLRVKRWISGIEDRLRALFILGYKVSEFFGRDVYSFVFVFDRFYMDRLLPWH
jgi:hypothetical protein